LCPELTVEVSALYRVSHIPSLFERQAENLQICSQLCRSSLFVHSSFGAIFSVCPVVALLSDPVPAYLPGFCGMDSA